MSAVELAALTGRLSGLMSAHLDQARLEKLLSRFPDARIAVLGDFFLDRYWDIDPRWEERSVETGKPAHQIARVRCSPGAAGTVVANLAALDTAKLQAVGFTGNDGEAFELRRGLTTLGCSTEHLHTADNRYTPTYTKPRNLNTPGLAGEHSRLDTKNRQNTPESVQQAVIDSLHSIIDQVDAVIVIDQVEATDCGTVTQPVREALSAIAQSHERVHFWVDSRRHIHEFRHVIVKPNEFETVHDHDPKPGASVPIEQLKVAGHQMHQRTGSPVFITRGARGICVAESEWSEIPAVHVEGETDTTGAGDSATAGCVLALCAGASSREAALTGNLVASLTIQQLATTGTANRSQLPERLHLWQTQQTQSGEA